MIYQNLIFIANYIVRGPKKKNGSSFFAVAFRIGNYAIL